MFVRHVQAPLGFRARVMARIAAESPSLRDRLVRWLSPAWHPIASTADGGSAQKHVFPLEDGNITVTCDWWIPQQDQPGRLRVEWQAQVALPVEFWARFTRPDDPTALLAEIHLGNFLWGEKVFTVEMLGFDPAREPWAFAIVLRELPA